MAYSKILENPVIYMLAHHIGYQDTKCQSGAPHLLSFQLHSWSYSINEVEIVPQVINSEPNWFQSNGKLHIFFNFQIHLLFYNTNSSLCIKPQKQFQPCTSNYLANVPIMDSAMWTCWFFQSASTWFLWHYTPAYVICRHEYGSLVFRQLTHCLPILAFYPSVNQWYWHGCYQN